MCLEGGLHVFDFAFWDQAIFDKTFGVQCQRGLLLFDLFVHHRVGEHRFVAFVVTKAAVADDVEDNVFVEFLTEFGGDARGVDNGLWVITVYVEDRCLDHQCDVCWVRRRAREVRCSGETDLVVNHDVHGATGFVPL